MYTMLYNTIENLKFNQIDFLTAKHESVERFKTILTEDMKDKIKIALLVDTDTGEVIAEYSTDKFFDNEVSI